MYGFKFCLDAFLSGRNYLLLGWWTDSDETLGLYTVRFGLTPEVLPVGTGSWLFAMKPTIFRQHFFLVSIKPHTESFGSHSDIGGTGNTDKNRKFPSISFVSPISKSKPIDSGWVRLTRGKIGVEIKSVSWWKSRIRFPGSDRKWESHSGDNSSRTV